MIRNKVPKNNLELINYRGELPDRGVSGRKFTIFFLWYMRLVWRTSTYELINRELLTQDTLIGFWHGDSFCMQFILQDIARDHEKINVIVTSKGRGKCIAQMVHYNGGTPLRLPDGLEMRSMFSELLTIVKEPGSILAVALDGPAGPNEEPKKLVFLLASKSGKKVLGVHFRFHFVWRMGFRWDNYKIPLPFGKITAQFQEIGEINQEKLRNFDEWKDGIEKTV